MGKSCLNKLSDNITVVCTIAPVGVKNLYLMHSGEVTFTLDPNGTVTNAAFSGSAKTIRIEGYKQNLQVTSSVASMDASQKLAISVMFKIPSVSASLMRSFLLGGFYILVERNDGTHHLIGVQVPLECSSFDFDSNSNACLATVTLTHPEGSAGNYFTAVTASAITTIKSKVGG